MSFSSEVSSNVGFVIDFVLDFVLDFSFTTVFLFSFDFRVIGNGSISSDRATSASPSFGALDLCLDHPRKRRDVVPVIEKIKNCKMKHPIVNETRIMIKSTLFGNPCAFNTSFVELLDVIV